jgi:lysophospholipase L1-like esterase
VSKVFSNRTLASALVFLLCIAAGAVLRPYLAAAARWGSSRPDPVVAPLNPSLWNAKVDQFRATSGTAVAGETLVVFLGDSITDWVNLEDLWQIGGGRVLNRGIAGDTTAGVIARLDASVPPEARVCFLLVGYNDLLRGAPAAIVSERIAAAATELAALRPSLHVVVETVPGLGLADVRADLHHRLRQAIPPSPRLSLLDLAPALAPASDPPGPSLFADQVHLSALGSRRRAASELAHLRRIDPALASRISLRWND